MSQLNFNVNLVWNWKHLAKLAFVLALMYGAYRYGYNQAIEICSKWIAENCAEAVKS